MDRPRILLTRLSAIGDCMETLPLAMALKERWPQAQITWIVDCGVDSLLKGHPAIDRVLRLRKRFLSRPREVWRLRQQLSAERFDIAIDPQGLLKSALLGWLAGAKHRIGFSQGQAREQAWRLYHDAIAPTATHLVDRQLELLRPLGIENAKVDFGWSEAESVRGECDALLRCLDLEPRGYAVINPGASWASKRWPTERFHQVAQRLYADYRWRSLIVWGNEEERSLAESIAANAREACTLAPDTSLPTLAGLLKRSRMYIGSDTGPMHMAVAVGTPCVGLFGVTRAEYCGPYGSIHRALQYSYDGGSSRYRRHTTNRAMQQISVEAVLEACRQVDAADHSSPFLRAS